MWVWIVLLVFGLYGMMGVTDECGLCTTYAYAGGDYCRVTGTFSPLPAVLCWETGSRKAESTLA